MRSKIIGNLIIVLFIASACFAAPKTVRINGEVYERKNTDILTDSLNLCQCIKEVQKKESVRSDTARAICMTKIIEALMKKSEKSNRIETISLVECSD